MKVEVGGGSFRRLSRSWYLGCCLLDAMKYGRWEDVLALTKIKELDPNVLLPEYGIAPMHCAAGIEPEEFGVRCVQEFLRLGGDPNVSCSEGVTPVHVASCWGRPNVLKCLLKKGGDPHLLDHEGKDAFYYAQDKKKVVDLLTANENNKYPSLPTGNDSKSVSQERHQLNKSIEVCNDDLVLNSQAFLLIFKHRKSVLIFESIPEDDSTSSTITSEDNREDFAFEPSEDNISLNKSDNTKANKVGIETWVSTKDNEIKTENILKADKTKVIQVINDNINKCFSGSSISNGKSEVTGDLSDKSSYLSDQTWTDNNYNNNHRSRSKIANENQIVYDNNPELQMDATSTNVLKMKPKSVKSNETSRTRKIKSQSSCSFIGSESDYRTPMESYQAEQIGRTSSLESSPSTKSRIKLPKHMWEKLEGFRINTHYRSKTRIFRMVSKSCEGFKIKKSLYTTGFEFWSTKIKSKSNPSSVKRMSKNLV